MPAGAGTPAARIRLLLAHRLVQNTLVLFGVQISGYLLPLITLPYLTRVLGPANFGLLALGTALALYFMVITEYGFSLTATRRVAIVHDDPAWVARVYSTVMASKAALLAPCFLALVAIVFAVPRLRPYWALYLVSFLLVVGYALSPTWLFQGLQRMKLVAWPDYGAKIISVALIFLLVRRSGDYLTAAALQSGAFVISGAIGLAFVFLVLKIRPVKPARADMREAMVEGWPVFLSMAAITVTSSSNTVILGMLASPAQVGYFSAATRLLVAARALINPVTNAVYPHMSLLASRSREEALRFFRRRLVWVPVPFLAASVALFVGAPYIVRLVYGACFAETGVLLRVMSLAVFMQAASTCFGAYYMLAFGYEKEWSKIVRWSMLVNFGLLAPLCFVMPPVYAVAVASTATDIYAAVHPAVFYYRTARR